MSSASSRPTKLTFNRGSVIWGKLDEKCAFWPGMVVSGSDVGVDETSKNYHWIFWFDIKTISKVSKSNILDFIPNYKNIHQRDMQFSNYYKGVASAFSVCEIQKYFDSESGKLAENHLSVREICIPLFIENQLAYIKRKLSNYRALHESHIPDLNDSFEQQKNKFIKQPFDSRHYFEVMDKMKNGLIQVSDICVCCKMSVKEGTNKPHPLFAANCCDNCFERIKYTMYTTGEDNVHVYCTVCAQTGNMFVCEKKNCCRVFCFNCVQMFWGEQVKSTIVNTNTWFCFLCVESGIKDVLKTNQTWQINVVNLFQNVKSEMVEKPIDVRKQKLRVLSLFDGISAGLVALEKLGFDLEVYFACEISRNAIAVSHENHGSKSYFKSIGNIKRITSQMLADLGSIDLLIGGSPCNDLSLVNPVRKGLMNGTGIYFFDFMRILLNCQQNRGKYPVFWLFENVAAMPKQFQKLISRFLCCKPVVVNAKYYSPQTRARLFWGNIPGLTSVDSNFEFLSDKKLDSFLDKQKDRKAVVDKINTVTTNPNSLRQGKFGFLPVLMNGQPDMLWITEIERIFGFPVHYTDAANLSVRKRQILLGKSWSVPVICQILQPLRNYFSLKEE